MDGLVEGIKQTATKVNDEDRWGGDFGLILSMSPPGSL